MLFSSECDNPNSMVIFDPVDQVTYKEWEAKSLPDYIRRRLVNRCLLKGYNVMTTEEATDKLWNKTNNQN